MSGSRNTGNEHPSDTRPFLCMPYWITPLVPGGKWDDGELRPLTKNPGVISYMCNAIHPGPYSPSKPLDVRVDVLNSGGGNAAAIAIVSVYWADPTVGFAKPNFLAATPVVTQPSPSAPNIATTATITGTIPATAPPHVCLVVSVGHALDKPGTTCDPVGDRHWAQRNLQAVATAVAGPTLIQFAAGNPFESKKVFDLVIQKTDMRQARTVAGAFHVTASDMQVKLRLMNVQGAPLSPQGPQARTRVELGPRDKQQLQIEAETDNHLPAGQGIALEALLLDPGHDGRLVGSLGTVLLGR